VPNPINIRTAIPETCLERGRGITNATTVKRFSRPCRPAPQPAPSVHAESVSAWRRGRWNQNRTRRSGRACSSKWRNSSSKESDTRRHCIGHDPTRRSVVGVALPGQSLGMNDQDIKSDFTGYFFWLNGEWHSEPVLCVGVSISSGFVFSLFSLFHNLSFSSWIGMHQHRHPRHQHPRHSTISTTTTTTPLMKHNYLLLLQQAS